MAHADVATYAARLQVFHGMPGTAYSFRQVR